MIFSAAARSLIVVAHRPVIAAHREHRQLRATVDDIHRRPKQPLDRSLPTRSPPAASTLVGTPAAALPPTHPPTHLNLHHPRSLSPPRAGQHHQCCALKQRHPACLTYATRQPRARGRERIHANRPQPRSRSLVHPHLHAHRRACLRVCSQPWRSISRTRMLDPEARDSLDGRNCHILDGMCIGRATLSHVALREGHSCVVSHDCGLSALRASFADLPRFLVFTGQTSF